MPTDARDTDQDGKPDYLDPDDDGDGFADCADFSSCNPPTGTRSPACI